MNLIKSRGFFGSSVTAKQETFKPFLVLLGESLGVLLYAVGALLKPLHQSPFLSWKRKVSQLSILLSQRKRRMKAELALPMYKIISRLPILKDVVD